MRERREKQRHLTLKTGKIRSLWREPEIDCAILDLSDSGARILLPAGTDLPDSFDLSVDPDGQVKCCRVVWKAGTSVGVTFQTRVLL